VIDIGVDIGGTFTDVVLLRDHRLAQQTKVPTTPADPILGVRQGVQRVLDASGLRPAEVDRFVHGSTVAVNALLQRKGAVTGILATEGFEDALEIGRHKRSRLYELMLEPETPAFLAPRHRRLGIAERVAANGAVVKPLQDDDVRAAIGKLLQHDVTAIAVCYLFSFRNPAHELRTRDIIGEVAPALHISLSCEVDPAFREYERTVMTTLDAYLHGAVGDYVERLTATLRQMGFVGAMQVMQSRGGITSAGAVARRPLSLLLSGLAAGVVGSKFIAANSGHDDAISLDMGGTSCDVALVRAGKPIITNQTRLAQLPLRMQMIDVNTIGAGGGSIAWIDATGGLRVGPQSAGALPGPACYGRGGEEATVTDASVVLGYLNPSRFADGDLALDAGRAEAAIGLLAKRIGLSMIATAAGIHRIVNARMADEIRRVSVQRGYDPREFALLPLGGAGPVHGGALALELAMPRVVVPDSPGVLSAFGLLVADIEHDQMETFAQQADLVDINKFEHMFDRLTALGQRKMQDDGVPLDQVAIERSADMRYIGQSYELAVAIPRAAENSIAAAVAAFHATHQAHYGHSDPAAAVEFVNLRTVHTHRLDIPPAASPGCAVDPDTEASAFRQAYFERIGGFTQVPVYRRPALATGQIIAGPAIIEQADTTVIVYPGLRAHTRNDRSIILEAANHAAQ
jgi:N-methylhydantoinase A